MNDNKKSPSSLGARPESFYKEQRLLELARAINRYVEEGMISGSCADLLQLWCNELHRRLEEYK